MTNEAKHTRPILKKILGISCLVLSLFSLPSQADESWTHNLQYGARERTNYNLDDQDISLYTELVNYKETSQIQAKGLDSINSNLTARLNSDTELQIGLDMFNSRDEGMMYWNTAVRVRHNFIQTDSGMSFGVMPQLSLPPRDDVNSEQMKPGISLPFDVFLPSGLMFGFKTVMEKARDWDNDGWKTNFVTNAYLGHRLYEGLSLYLDFNDQRSSRGVESPESSFSVSLTQQVWDVVQLQIATNFGKGEGYSNMEHTFGISVLY